MRLFIDIHVVLGTSSEIYQRKKKGNSLKYCLEMEGLGCHQAWESSKGIIIVRHNTHLLRTFKGDNLPAIDGLILGLIIQLRIGEENTNRSYLIQ